MLDKPTPPSAFQTLINRQVIPAAIEAAALVEGGTGTSVLWGAEETV
jgi:hypothetical protein